MIIFYTHQWWLFDVLSVIQRYFVLEHDVVQRPALVSSGYFLFHRREESLWVEETSHPKLRWFFPEHPRRDLTVPVQQLVEPKTDGRRSPRGSQPMCRDAAVVQVIQCFRQNL